MKKIINIVKKKQDHFNRIEAATPVSEALCRLGCSHTDYLIVVDKEGRYLGLLTEQDINAKSFLPAMELQHIPVKEVMNRMLPAMDEQHTIEDCMHLMQAHRVKYVPVFNGFEFSGIVAAEDIVYEAATSRTVIFDDAGKPAQHRKAFIGQLLL